MSRRDDADSRLIFIAMPKWCALPNPGMPVRLHLLMLLIVAGAAAADLLFEPERPLAPKALFYGLCFAGFDLYERVRRGIGTRGWLAMLAGSGGDDRSRAVTLGLLEAGLTARWPEFSRNRHSYSRFAEIVAGAGHPVPTTIASRTLEEELRAVARPAHLLEAEPVGQRERSSTVLLVLLGVYVVGLSALLITLGMYRAGMFFLLGLALIVLVYVFNLASVRAQLGFDRADSGLPIAGPGVISDSTGQRWTIHDAVMFVWARKPGGKVSVVFLGEGRVLHMAFASTRDADFVTLWQRWNHPDPRPELLP